MKNADFETTLLACTDHTYNLLLFIEFTYKALHIGRLSHRSRTLRPTWDNDRAKLLLPHERYTLCIGFSQTCNTHDWQSLRREISVWLDSNTPGALRKQRADARIRICYARVGRDESRDTDDAGADESVVDDSAANWSKSLL